MHAVHGACVLTRTHEQLAKEERTAAAAQPAKPKPKYRQRQRNPKTQLLKAQETPKLKSTPKAQETPNLNTQTLIPPSQRPSNPIQPKIRHAHKTTGNTFEPKLGGVLRFYLTQYDDVMLSESQLPHKIVNLLFAVAD